MIVLVGVLGVVGIAWVVVRAKRARDVVRVDGWSGAPDGALAVAVPHGSSSAVARVLGRVEARKLTTSLAFLAGLALSVVVVLFLSGVSDIIDNDAVLGRLFQHLGLAAYPLAGMTLLATNRAALRSSREGTAELFDVTPTTATTRTGAHLCSVVTPAIAATALVGVVLVVAPFRDAAGSWGPAWIAEAMTALVLVVGAGALGVALARWLPHGVVAPIALVVLLFATTALNGVRPYANNHRYWSPFATPQPDLSPDFMLRPAWPHLLYLVGLVGVVAAVALLRTGRSRSVIAVLITAVLVVAVGGWLQQRPVSASEARRVAAELTATADRCETRGIVRACTFAGYEEWRGDWIDTAARVLALVPAGERPNRYVARQAVGNAAIRRLEPEVRDAADGRLPRSGYGFGGVETELAWALLPAQAVVGLPTAIGPYESPCYSGNQARAVVALWLAGAVAPDALDDRWFEPDAESDGIGATWYSEDAPWAIAVWPALWDTDVDAPIVFARADLAVADQLRGLPIIDVGRRLSAEWPRWSDPSTTIAELVAALGLRPVATGSAARVPAGLSKCA